MKHTRWNIPAQAQPDQRSPACLPHTHQFLTSFTRPHEAWGCAWHHALVKVTPGLQKKLLQSSQEPSRSTRIISLHIMFTLAS